MKTIISAVLAVGLCGLAGAQDNKADPVGSWKCTYEVGGQSREATLAIKKDGDKYAGTMTFQDKQEAKLKDVKFKDGELSFSADREIMGQTITIDYKLKFDGDKCKGKAASDFGGQKVEFDIEGKREKKAK